MQTTNHIVESIIIYTTIIILLMTILTVSFLYAYQKKKVKSAAKLIEIKNEYEKLILNAQIEIQKQTFEEISREIHDNIGLSLTLAKLNINTIEIENKDETNEKVEKSSMLLGKAISDLRALSHSMNSEYIKSNGLINALRSEVERINKTTKLDVKFSILGAPAFFNSSIDLIVFRSIQELLNNILKHANANAITITVDFFNAEIKFCIEDDGSGFKQLSIDYEKGSGLKSVKNRIEQINGKVQINSCPKGTKILLLIPYKK